MRYPTIVLAWAAAAAAGCAQAPSPPPASAVAPALHAAGRGAPLTLYPVGVLGKPSVEVAEVLGLVLERHGMTDLELAERPFDPTDTAWDHLPQEFAAFVRNGGAEKRWGLYAQFLGDPRSGPTEVRFVVVGDGRVALADRQTPGDAAFARTAGRDPDPLGCAALVGERLFALADWKRGSVPAGKFAELWRKKSRAPDAAERAAMAERQEALRGRIADASIAVLPSLIAGKADPASAQRIADSVAAALGCKAAPAVSAGPVAVASSANQQRRLFDLAAALREEVGAHPIAADYALVADLGVDAERGRGYVNFVLCSKSGDVVIADFQNDQQPMFAELGPKTTTEAEPLVAARLRRLLR